MAADATGDGTMLRVARIPYLNSAPFYVRFPAPGLELLDLPPRQLGEAARRGEVDAGILSLCDTFEIDGFEPLGELGIVAPGAAHSVLLFCRCQPDQLGDRVVGVTSETATSIRLLELLLRRRFGVTGVRLERRDAPAADDDAQLLIGDRALAEAGRLGIWPGRSAYGPGVVPVRGDRWSWMLDLGAEWRAWQGLPFVFARWMVRRGVDADARAALAATLEGSLQDSETDLATAAAHYSGATALDRDAAVAYLRGFRYRFGDEERRAIRVFHEMIEAGAAVAPAHGPLTGAEA